MSETKEGELDVCRDCFEEEYLQGYLEHVAKTLGISDPKYCIKLGTKAGDNYVGIVYRVSIEGEKNGSRVKTETIFKVAPKDEMLRQILQVPIFFAREQVFYSEIVPIFDEFLRSKNKRLENIPQCHFSSSVAHKELICLEDLRVKGFVMRDRIKQMDFPHISLALSVLGRFHAVSFALRDQRPEIFTDKITKLKATLNRQEVLTDPHYIEHFTKLGNLVKTALAEEDPKYTERFSTYMKDALSHMEWSSDGKNAEPYAVLCHGDFWMNNMLFKYNEEDSSEPRDIYLLDFQLPSYASPVIDISYILFCNCSQELRNKHFDELIKIYHDSLSDYLSELGSDPKKLFPYEALWEQIEKFSVNAAGMANMVLPVFTTQGDDNKRVSSDSASHMAGLEKRIHRDDFWRNTTGDTFKDLIDRNFI